MLINVLVAHTRGLFLYVALLIFMLYLIYVITYQVVSVNIFICLEFTKDIYYDRVHVYFFSDLSETFFLHVLGLWHYENAIKICYVCCLSTHALKGEFQLKLSNNASHFCMQLYLGGG